MTLRGILTLIACLLAGHAAAQDVSTFPNHAIKIIVCTPPGGGVDTVTRILADGLQKKFGQPVVVENHGGAAGNIGADIVSKSDPDGYTLLAAQPAPLTINPLLYKNINFDPAKFEPIAIMTSVDNVLLVRPDFPARTARDFIAYAKANPGKINYASQGIGTTSHLSAAQFERVIGVKLQHVPYRGTGPALNDIIASHVDMIFMELASAIKLHEAGRARIIAVATDKRLPSLPDIPTLEEVGVKGFRSSTWNAIVAPPKTPPAVLARLNKAVDEVLADPAVQAHFGQITLRAVGGTRAEAKAFLDKETQVWGDVIRDAHIPMQ